MAPAPPMEETDKKRRREGDSRGDRERDKSRRTDTSSRRWGWEDRDHTARDRRGDRRDDRPRDDRRDERRDREEYRRREIREESHRRDEYVGRSRERRDDYFRRDDYRRDDYRSERRDDYRRGDVKRRSDFRREQTRASPPPRRREGNRSHRGCEESSPDRRTERRLLPPLENDRRPSIDEGYRRGGGDEYEGGDSDGSEGERDVRARRRRELERLRRTADDENENGTGEGRSKAGRITSEYLERLRHISETQRRAAAEAPAAVETAADEEAMDISDHSEGEADAGQPGEANVLDEESALIQEVMGFSTFQSSKGKQHNVAVDGGVSKKTKRKYRQYMNRRGGFNRPLSPVF
eukprot:Protomagalhaensia_sp_Gyna_25__1656@NODE_185_length_4558_cov_389_890020_g144_i0_p3_GENE_NODE_185_length_4558_cov_389_890020_g144_i0NODE_185_length_4558_cov_389_890020_g144_i0_p3_ORF_typecomplete_len352_score62_87SNRNP27/PF08648_12/6_2e24_NODE_185_length_4558_cov_389_890020_g144_i024103465